ncbi:ABC-2 family transporter protein [compost metagenome]
MIGSMKRVDTASGVSNVLYLVLAVMGGMWMPLESMPQIMQNIGIWLPSYNFSNGAWELIRGHAPEMRNILILLVYLILFMILSTYIRKKQEAV